MIEETIEQQAVREYLKNRATDECNWYVSDMMTMKGMVVFVDKPFVACSDEKRIYLGNGFMVYDANDKYFILLHEFLHLVYRHVERGMNKNKVLYNLAADIIINRTLGKRMEIPKDAITENTFEDKTRTIRKCNTTDEVYQVLCKGDPDTDMMKAFMVLSDLDASEYDIDTESIDEEIEQEKQECEENSEDSSDDGTGKEASKISPEEIIDDYRVTHVSPEEFSKATKTGIKKAMSVVEKFIGSLDTKDKVKGYQRPCRYNFGDNILRKGNLGMKSIPQVDFYIDCSGSMRDNYREIVGTFHSIKNQLKKFKPRFYKFDTNLHVLDLENPGYACGGTNFKVIVERPSEIKVIITDGEDDYQPILDYLQNRRALVITNCRSLKDNKEVVYCEF